MAARKLTLTRYTHLQLGVVHVPKLWQLEAYRQFRRFVHPDQLGLR